MVTLSYSYIRQYHPKVQYITLSVNMFVTYSNSSSELFLCSASPSGYSSSWGHVTL